MLAAFHLAVLAGFGLRQWVDAEQWDRVGGALLPLLAVAVPLDGRAFAHLGLTLRPLQGASVSDPTLLDTVAAMTLNGVGFLAAGILADRRGTPLMKAPARLLELIAPCATLEPRTASLC